MPGGRPKFKLEDLPKGWKESVESMYADGASDVEIRAYALGNISDDLWYRLLKEEPEFSRTIKNGRRLCESWWVKNGRTNLDSETFSYTGWYMNMKNRFGWADKQQVDNKHSGEVTVKSFFD
jgi:hypothetical protein